MPAKRIISVTLDQESIDHADALCAKLGIDSRSALFRFLIAQEHAKGQTP